MYVTGVVPTRGNAWGSKRKHMKAMLRSIRFSAEALGVSPYTIRRLVAAGQIQAVNIGARRLIPEAEIERVAAHGVLRSKLKRSERTTE
jgi:excisionase family DNA binding protein